MLGITLDWDEKATRRVHIALKLFAIEFTMFAARAK